MSPTNHLLPIPVHHLHTRLSADIRQSRRAGFQISSQANSHMIYLYILACQHADYKHSLVGHIKAVTWETTVNHVYPSLRSCLPLLIHLPIPLCIFITLTNKIHQSVRYTCTLIDHIIIITYALHKQITEHNTLMNLSAGSYMHINTTFFFLPPKFNTYELSCQCVILLLSSTGHVQEWSNIGSSLTEKKTWLIIILKSHQIVYTHTRAHAQKYTRIHLHTYTYAYAHRDTTRQTLTHARIFCCMYRTPMFQFVCSVYNIHCW